MESQNTTKVVKNAGRFQKGHKKIGGREKGTPNKETRLKNEVLDMLEKRRNEFKEIPIVDLLRVGASFVPKELKGEGFDNKNIVYVIQGHPKRREDNRVQVLSAPEPAKD